MQIGFIGLKYSGKSTLFQLLTEGHFESLRTGAGEYFRGNVTVPDNRIDKLSDIFQPKKTTYTHFECIDVMGLPSTKRRDQSGKYLEAVRQTDALVAVIQVFDGFDDAGNAFRIAPPDNMVSLEDELVFSDLLVLESRLEKLDSLKKRGAPQYDHDEHVILEKCHAQLENNLPLRELALAPEEKKKIRGFQFLSEKPLIVVLNCDESTYPEREKYIADIHRKQANLAVTAVNALAEKEIQELDEEEQRDFMQDLGISEPAIFQVIKAAYEGLGLISFFTVGEDEVRAWTAEQGCSAPEAAGKIHSDLQTGFIRAETIHFDTFMEAGSYAEAKTRGLLRLEGKEYIVKDGDILNIRFNV